MHILAWNLNHRTREKPIPSSTLDVLKAINPHLVVLNEYVDGETRGPFKQQLKDIGLCHQLLSEQVKGQNQVFIASRHRLLPGELPVPNIDDASRTNFLHVRIPDYDIEIVGFRAPAYKLRAERDQYWKSMRSVMSLAAERAICFVGDANFDPFVGPACDALEVQFEIRSMYRVPRPKGDWSFVSMDGTNRSRIDHAFLSPALDYRNPRYIHEHDGIVLAGPNAASPITDHAALSIHLIRKASTVC